MVLTNKQEEGLRIAVARHRAGEKYTVIGGNNPCFLNQVYLV